MNRVPAKGLPSILRSVTNRIARCFLADRLRKDLGRSRNVIIRHLLDKYKMEEGRDYTMVSEVREVNRHHYNDKPRKISKPLPKKSRARSPSGEG